MGKVPNLFKYVVITIAVAFFLGLILYFIVDYTSLFGNNSVNNGKSEVRISTNSNQTETTTFSLYFNKRFLEESVELSIEIPEGITLEEEGDDISNKVSLSNDSFAIEFQPNTPPDPLEDLATFKVKEAIPIKNQHIRDLFLVKSEDGRYFIVTDPSLSEKKNRRKVLKERLDAVLRQGNYLPLAVYYFGGEENISDLIEIVSTAKFKGQSSKMLSNRAYMTPVEYWPGDGGVLLLLVEMEEGGEVVISHDGTKSITSLKKDDLQIDLAIPNTSRVRNFPELSKVGVTGGRSLYRYLEEGQYTYTSDVSLEPCVDPDSGDEVAPPCGTDLLFLEDKGVLVSYNGLNKMVEDADNIVLSISLPK